MSAPRRLSLYSQYLTGLPGQSGEPRSRLHLKAISGGKIRLQLDSPHTEGASPRLVLTSEQRLELAQFLLANTPDMPPTERAPTP